MSYVHASPDAIEGFRLELQGFNNEVDESTRYIRSELQQLGTTWQDKEYVEFASTFEDEVSNFLAYLDGAEAYLNDLRNKALVLHRYLGS